MIIIDRDQKVRKKEENNKNNIYQEKKNKIYLEQNKNIIMKKPKSNKINKSIIHYAKCTLKNRIHKKKIINKQKNYKKKKKRDTYSNFYFFV